MSEIIIDEVDVSGCIYYNGEKLANCGMFALGDFKCEGQICLYKQLKRLQEKYDTLINKFLNSETDKYKLKKENTKLKENQCKKCDFQKQYFSETKRLMNINHKLRLGCLKCECKNTKADVDKYKQILQDIKTLVTKHYYQTKKELVQNYDFLDCFMQKIEDKCNEVIE